MMQDTSEKTRYPRSRKVAESFPLYSKEQKRSSTKLSTSPSSKHISSRWWWTTFIIILKKYPYRGHSTCQAFGLRIPPAHITSLVAKAATKSIQTVRISLRSPCSLTGLDFPTTIRTSSLCRQNSWWTTAGSGSSAGQGDHTTPTSDSLPK